MAGRARDFVYLPAQVKTEYDDDLVERFFFLVFFVFLVSE